MTYAFRNDLILVDGFPKSVKTFATQYEYPHYNRHAQVGYLFESNTHISMVCGHMWLQKILPKNTWFIRYRSMCSDIAHHHDLAKKLT
jgi:hypothetical protein